MVVRAGPVFLLGAHETPPFIQSALGRREVPPQRQHHGAALAGGPIQATPDPFFIPFDDPGGSPQRIPLRQCPRSGFEEPGVRPQTVVSCCAVARIVLLKVLKRANYSGCWRRESPAGPTLLTEFFMLIHPDFDPVAFSLGPLNVRWYGLMYLFGFLAGWALGRYRVKQPGSGWTTEQMDDLVFHIALGVILGGRIGYILFYSFGAFLHDPLTLFRIWEGGMSFHGGFLGVLLAMALFARKHQKRFWATIDFIAPLIPPGLFFGRTGNFINGELWGRVTDRSWGMVFRQASDGLPRHPSQLYEAALEGVALFLIVWLFSARPRPTMAVSGVFALSYGVFRFLVEFVRQPDAQLGYLAFGWLTMGQLLSLPLIVVGAVLLTLAYRRKVA
jgi:phosphatidylglycerol:prolipoprotein diacylglycerol transferase